MASTALGSRSRCSVAGAGHCVRCYVLAQLEPFLLPYIWDGRGLIWGLVSVSGGGKRKEAFMLLVVFNNISKTQRGTMSSK